MKDLEYHAGNLSLLCREFKVTVQARPRPEESRAAGRYDWAEYRDRGEDEVQVWGGVGLPECTIGDGDKGGVIIVESKHQHSCCANYMCYFISPGLATLSGEYHYYLHLIDETVRLKCCSKPQLV